MLMLHEVTDFAMVVLSHIVMSLLSYCSSSDIKKAWNRPVVHSTNRGSCIAYQSRTDNVRAHADMNNRYLKRPI